MKIDFTADELDALYECLTNVAMDMDDDGRDGAFDASPLRPAFNKIREAARESGNLEASWSKR